MAEDRTYPRSARLTRTRQIEAVVARGEVFPGQECLVRRLANEGRGARLGVAAPRGYGGAVRRNRFRRIVREAFRSVRARLGDQDLFVSPRRGLREPSLEGIRRDLLRTLDAAPAARRPASPGAGP